MLGFCRNIGMGINILIYQFRTAKIDIEIDGKRHLTDPHQIISDLSRSHYSDTSGYETVHIPNEYIHSDLEKIAKALAEAAKIREKQL